MTDHNLLLKVTTTKDKKDVLLEFRCKTCGWFIAFLRPTVLHLQDDILIRHAEYVENNFPKRIIEDESPRN